MFIYAMILVNLILGGLCLYKQYSFSGIYLLLVGFSDILKLIVRAVLVSLSAPVPFTGTALVLFNLHNLIYLSVPLILLKICYRSVLKDSRYLPELLGLTSFLAAYLIYPAIRGAQLILGFNIFYILIDLFCGGIILNFFTKTKGNKDQLILLICAFGGAASFILNIIFGNWIVILTCNFLYYLAILWLLITDKNALPEFLQSS